ncbi:PE-PGRS family protein PE_PGRS16-like [Anneissia japonica]|uniref:PE-PGRS family protein PE_PGRS16-like n=1 Tax=Anneissia japonica TaxID=1529436 RepID=UPI0014255542|nr:PE-PGRS family protein PE_PGRS16-like [Anneissia japonica]
MDGIPYYRYSTVSVVLAFTIFLLTCTGGSVHGACPNPLPGSAGTFRVPDGETCHLAAGSYTFGQVDIKGRLVINATTDVSSLTLVATSVDIGTTGSIDADGAGYGAGKGLGSGGATGSGGGHGGRGGMSSSSFLSIHDSIGYDDLTAPSMPGSGGGGSYGGAGGGAVSITAGSISLDGTITANGANAFLDGNGNGGSGGGGSGGSVYIRSTSTSSMGLSGSGVISVNGGRGNGKGGGGGAGGRVSIAFNSGSFTGLANAHGGRTDLEDGVLPVSPSDLSSRSQTNSNYAPSYGLRINGSSHFWRGDTRTNVNEQYLQVTFQDTVMFSGLDTRGCASNCPGSGQEYVKTYYLMYEENDGEGYKEYKVTFKKNENLPLNENAFYDVLYFISSDEINEMVFYFSHYLYFN